MPELTSSEYTRALNTHAQELEYKLDESRRRVAAKSRQIATAMDMVSTMISRVRKHQSGIAVYTDSAIISDLAQLLAVLQLPVSVPVHSPVTSEDY